MEIILINEELFRENSPVREDTTVTKFAPYIAVAQKIYIEKILGRALTDELKLQVKAATRPNAPSTAITPQNKALILALAPALSFYAVYQGLPFHWAAIQNKGVTIRESENSRGADIQDLAQLRRWIKDDAEVLVRDLIEYLSRCRAKYPLWDPGVGCCMHGGQSGSDRTELDTGILIPQKRCTL